MIPLNHNDRLLNAARLLEAKERLAKEAMQAQSEKDARLALYRYSLFCANANMENWETVLSQLADVRL